MTELLAYPALPEIIMAVGAMALLMQGAFSTDDTETGQLASWLAYICDRDCTRAATSTSHGLPR